MNKEILLVVDAVRMRRASTRKSSSTRSRRRWLRPRARSTAKNGTCASRSTARPAIRHLPPLEGLRRRFPRDGSATARVAPRGRARREQGSGGGRFVEEPMESVAFGRIAAQQAKQVIVQKVREAERSQVVDAYKDRVGTLVSGVVSAGPQRHLRRPRRQRRRFRAAHRHDPARNREIQDRIKAFLKEVRSSRAARTVPHAHGA